MKESHHQTKKPSKSSPRFFTLLKPVVYFAIFAGAIFGLYRLSDSLNIADWFSSDKNRIASETEGRTPAAQSAPRSEIPAGQSETTEPQPVVHPVDQKTQIEILNGCGVSGVAMKATEYLRREEIDVVYMGNYTSFDVQNSQVLDRAGNLKNAQKIARILGIPESQVKAVINKNKQLDASVILGKDYQKLKPYQK